ncbi:MAG: GNAT family N-acetyltransferase [Bacteroidota bacterium]
MEVLISDRRDLPEAAVLALYRANDWSSADKPAQLMAALRHSHTLLSAWVGERLVGLGNAISDGHLVVYYPHLLVHPDFQGRGIGKKLLAQMQAIYGDFHMQMLTADGKAIDFYARNGFEKAGETQAMWIYGGGEH